MKKIIANTKIKSAGIIEPKKIEIRCLTGSRIGRCYRVTTPFGYAYTKNFQSILSAKEYYPDKLSKREIEILNVQ